jgi:pyruvate formate lyase activating enzyme
MSGQHHPIDGSIGWLHSVDTGAAVDGPGVRFVYFLSGCLFRCLYCHNPDTWEPHGGRRLTLDEAVAEVAPYAGFLRMAGGVTVSGGEPLMQAPFVGRLLRRLKEEFGLHTALDTQGYLGVKADDAWLEAVDLVLLDIKHADPAQYERITSRPLQPTLDFAHRLAALGKRIWLRYVLVPGLTDEDGDVARLADIAAGLGPVVERVEVLPFHQMGASKWRALRLDYQLADTPTPTPEQVRRARDIFSARGLVAT